MRAAATALLVLVGLVNIFPVIGVLSDERVVALYGIVDASPDTLILLRHRAVLFGLLGGFIIYAAFERTLRMPACAAGFVSMVSFVVLAVAGDYGEALHKVVVIDILATVALLLVFIVEARRWRPSDTGWGPT